jgi:hypothetical protein
MYEPNPFENATVGSPASWDPCPGTNVMNGTYYLGYDTLIELPQTFAQVQAYYAYVMCSQSVKFLRMLLYNADMISPKYLETHEKLQRSILDSWDTILINVAVALDSSNSLRAEDMLWNLYDLNAHICNVSLATNCGNIGIPSSLWDNPAIARIFSLEKREITEAIFAAYDAVWQSDITYYNVLGMISISEREYFNVCRPTGCTKLNVQTTSESVLAALSFAGGLFPAFVVTAYLILEIITAVEHCRKRSTVVRRQAARIT